MPFTRQELEEIEDNGLASYGCRSRLTKGRVFPEDEPQYRTSFQRDRDRILHTTAFRRLEYKTQVFINYESDYYRTRLIHTLEVSQIGRRICRSLGGNEDLVEAICLAHDLGYPAFGPSGEATLTRLMKDIGGFDHNKQSLRIVTQLERSYPDYPGLNLTWEVREGIVKHESEYDTSDSVEYNPELRGNLESQIANAADELTYNAQDLDDGLRSGMITPQMLEGITLWEIMAENIAWLKGAWDDLTRQRLVRHLIDLEVSDMLQSTHKRILDNNIKTVEEVQAQPLDIVGYSDDFFRWNRELKDFLYTSLYRNHRVVRMAKKAEKLITNLFNAYLAEPVLLPDQVQKMIELHGKEQTICDYIAGMTDRFALREHKKLFDPAIMT